MCSKFKNMSNCEDPVYQSLLVYVLQQNAIGVVCVILGLLHEPGLRDCLRAYCGFKARIN